MCCTPGYDILLQDNVWQRQICAAAKLHLQSLLNVHFRELQIWSDFSVGCTGKKNNMSECASIRTYHQNGLSVTGQIWKHIGNIVPKSGAAQHKLVL